MSPDILVRRGSCLDSFLFPCFPFPTVAVVILTSFSSPPLVSHRCCWPCRASLGWGAWSPMFWCLLRCFWSNHCCVWNVVWCMFNMFDLCSSFSPPVFFIPGALCNTICLFIYHLSRCATQWWCEDIFKVVEDGCCGTRQPCVPCVAALLCVDVWAWVWAWVCIYHIVSAFCSPVRAVAARFECCVVSVV